MQVLPLTGLLRVVQSGHTVYVAMWTYCMYCNLQALLVGIEQGQLQWKALPLILQRAVMVAMKASSPEGLSPAAPPLQAYHSQEDRQRFSNSAAGVTNSSHCCALDVVISLYSVHKVSGVLAFSLLCKLPPASHLLFKMTLLCTESNILSCYCKAVQKPVTTPLLIQISSVHTV